MSKFYIGGVANVDAFTNNSGKPEHLFSAKTLTDSSINISVSNEEIRGGEGAQLLGKFFHTTVFNLSLTDALFDLNYIGKQVGDDPEMGAAVKMKTVTLSSEDISGTTATFTLSNGEVISPMSFGNMYSNDLICWDADGNTYYVDGTAPNYTITVAAGTTELCLTVPVSAEGNQIVVNAMYYPGVFSLIMRAKLFAGDACKASDGKPVGELVIEIPKFQLDGTVDLAMAMTSPATYALNGSALANGCGCEANAWYAKITEVLLNQDPFDGYTGIVVDMDSVTVGDTLSVYAFAPNKVPKALSVDQYTVAGNGAIAANGVITTAGDVVITANGSALANTSAIYNEEASATFEQNA